MTNQTPGLDPFAFAREPQVADKAGLDAICQRLKVLFAEAIELGKLLPAGEPVNPPARREPEPVTEAEREALRQECEAIAAEYRAPLPDGDAGLVAALQRWLDLQQRTRLGSRGFKVTKETEKEIVNPIADAAESELWDWIRGTPATGLAGVIAKLRFALEDDCSDLDDINGEQLIEVIEREVGR
jgi:hypothetical protein